MSDYHVQPAVGSSGRNAFLVFKGSVIVGDPFFSRQLAMQFIEQLEAKDKKDAAPTQPLLNPIKDSDLIDE